MLEKLKMLLGITDDSKDGILNFALEYAQDFAKNYCNIEAIPQGAETLIVRMAADLYRSEGYGQGEKPQTAKSVRRGDVTVDYGNASATAAISGEKSVLDDYRTQLNAFRRLRW